MIRTGELRVNGGRAKVDQRLAAGDLLRLPPLRNAPPVGTPPPTVSPYWREALLQGVLHEDDTLLVLDKPSGLAVHGGSGLSYGIIEALRALRPGDPYLELVHRIDRETSGILLLAKSPSMLRTLHQIFRTGNITKHYLALAVGQWPEGILTCESTLAKGIAVGGGGERLVRVDPDGKVALSRFRATERFEVQGHHFTLVEVEILTGRTHQIRVQAANTGYPLAGDPKYGNSDANRFLRDLGFDRLFLHARRVTLTLPGEGRPRIYTAPLPPDLLGFLESLRGAEGAGTPGP
jgi:23S rRNA pseudouridine955/2504/2580 synthase